MKKCYCLTLDDNIRFLEEACRRNERSLFDTAYLAMLRRLHGRFGCKVQLNVFSATARQLFTCGLPGRYRPELKKAPSGSSFPFMRATMIRLSYAAGGGALLADYLDVLRELARIAGPSALQDHHPALCRRHQKDCSLLRRFGVWGLIGMFTTAPAGKACITICRPRWPALRRGRILS